MTFYESIDQRRAIVDRRALLDRIAAGAAPEQVLADALAAGRAEIAARLANEPARGRAAARATAYLHDQIVRIAFDLTGSEFGQPLAIVGLGGTGRGEMAPFSDVDLMFLTPHRRAPWCEQVIEATL